MKTTLLGEAKALEVLRWLLGSTAAGSWQRAFARIGKMPGAARKFKRIHKAKGDKEQVLDYLAELRYTLAFAGLGFQVELVEKPNAPDFRAVRDGHTAGVEVKRLRLVHKGPPMLTDEDLANEMGILPRYASEQDIENDITKVWDDLAEKIGKMGNEGVIIALWSDDERLGELEPPRAVQWLCDEATEGIRVLPSGFQFVLYGSPWVSPRQHQQLWCFPVRKLTHPYDQWKRELEGSLIRDLVTCALTQDCGDS